MDDHDRTLNLAFELNNAGRTMEAEALCRVLVQVRPGDVQALFLLGMVLHKERQDEEAVKWLSQATQYRPESAKLFTGLGCAYQSLKDYSRAANAFEEAMKLEGPSAANCYNLGNNCFQLDQIERAAALFRQAVEINPRDFACWNNLGKCLKELNRLDESIEAYNRALNIAPDYGVARYGRAISLLAAGRLTEGCREFEWRWHSLKPRTFPGTAWRGETLPDQTLLLSAEQGFGDAIQMVRFVAAARERVGRVILECRPELAALFQYSKCADTIVPAGTPIPPFDSYLSLISVPHIFGITLDNIPAKVPYLAAPAMDRLPGGASGRLKVGLVWAGSPAHHQDNCRSIPLADFAPILQVPGVAFYSLQKPVPTRDADYLQSQTAIINTSLELPDFLHTASVINELDLVITVDTGVAHLAGALGKPVWMLIQHSADWRWFLDSTTTPWYPTMQLFRQTTRSQWAPPIARVAKALRQLVEKTVSASKPG
jgi:tetratricopeptide (TPR) repeat protein